MSNYFVELILLTCGGFASGYMVSYFKKKGELKAIKEDLDETESQKKKIEARYNVLEDKLKHSYVEKIESYKKFCRSLDEYQSRGEELLKDKVLHIINRFYTNIKEDTAEAFLTYSQEMMPVMNEMNLSYRKLKNSSHEIKLFVSNKTLIKLNELMDVSKEIVNESIELVKELTKIEILTNLEQQKGLTTNITHLNEKSEIIIEEMMAQMRSEIHNEESAKESL